MRVGIGLIVVLGIVGCGKGSKSTGGDLPRNLKSEVQVVAPTEPIAAPVFIRELVVRSSLGETKLEVYQGDPGKSPILGQIGELTAFSRTKTYPNLTQFPLNPVEQTSTSKSYPVYWAEIKPHSVALAVFVDEAMAASIQTPRQELKVFEVQPPGTEYCSTYRFKGLQFFSKARQEQLSGGLFNLAFHYAEPFDVACNYNRPANQEECLSYEGIIATKVFRAPVGSYTYANRLLMDQEANAFTCANRSHWMPPKEKHSETLKVEMLTVKLSEKDKGIVIQEQNSPLIPNGNQIKKIEFSENELKFTL